MSRDPKRLRAFHLAHSLVLAVFRHSATLPAHQRFVIQSQLQRAALSTACNIVEGCSRSGLKEYRHFVNVALASAREAEYLLSVASELGYLQPAALHECRNRCDALVGSLQNLLSALEEMAGEPGG
jgi:four helix bundle protein